MIDIFDSLFDGIKELFCSIFDNSDGDLGAYSSVDSNDIDVSNQTDTLDSNAVETVSNSSAFDFETNTKQSVDDMVVNGIDIGDSYTINNQGQPSFTGYTQNEIDSGKRECENKIEHYKNVIRNNEKMAAHKIEHGEPHSFEDSNISSAKIDLENARNKLRQWENEKPDKKNV